MPTNGEPSDAIAEELALSLHTVRNHARIILTKLGAHPKLQAVAIAIRRELVDLDGEPSVG